MNRIETITKEIEGITWNIEVHEEKDLPEPDLTYYVMYYKCTNAQYDFIYKMRFSDILVANEHYDLGSYKNRKNKGLEKTKMLLKNKKYIDYICTFTNFDCKCELAK